MRTFELPGEEAALELEGAVPDPSSAHFGWNYKAHLRGHSLQADLAISDDNPGSFVDFFDSLARDWKGWPETRGYESLDGILSIAATHDRERTVRFEVRLRGDARSGFDWSATHRLTVGIGELGKLAAAAKAFAT